MGRTLMSIVRAALNPDPRPTQARPPDISSMVAMALAVTAGCRVKVLVTEGPMRTRLVLRAAMVMAG